MSYYLTSTDPEVLAVVERNEEGRRSAHDRAVAWAEERGADTCFGGFLGGHFSVNGLPHQPAGFGRWTKPNHRGMSAPFRNNAAEQAAMKALAFDLEVIPGLPSMVFSVYSKDGTDYMMSPRPFVALGAAWVGFGHMPEQRYIDDEFGDQWAECLGSQYEAAREAFNAAGKS